MSQATEWRPKIAHCETVGLIVKTGQAPERGERNIMRIVFCRPVRGWIVFGDGQPTVTPWATICRATGALLVVAAIFFWAAPAKAQTTNGLSEVEIKGRDLAFQIISAKPETNSEFKGIMKIRNSGTNAEFSFTGAVVVANTNWKNGYWFTVDTNKYKNVNTNIINISKLVGVEISHFPNRPTEYETTEGGSSGRCFIGMGTGNWSGESKNGYNSVCPNSDFWLCDLGLEFFHWPAQKILPKTTTLKRSREYTLLESTNPQPPTNGYSRVLSWIDKESGGILQAEAYDAQGKLLKVFEPKSFKKVNGQWELQEMEIRNVQTGSRTRLEFDLKQ